MEPNETKSNHKFKIILAIFLIVDVLFFLYLLVNGHIVALLEPKGVIALKEKGLILEVLLICMAVVIPVFCTAIYIIWKYRAEKKSENYQPNLQSSVFKEAILWSISIITISIIAVIIW